MVSSRASDHCTRAHAHSGRRFEGTPVLRFKIAALVRSTVPGAFRLARTCDFSQRCWGGCFCDCRSERQPGQRRLPVQPYLYGNRLRPLRERPNLHLRSWQWGTGQRYGRWQRLVHYPGSCATVALRPAALPRDGQSSGKLGAANFSMNPRLMPQPNAGAAGSTTTATGLGFGSFQTVRVYWSTPKTLLGTATANALGTFSGSAALTFAVPDGAPLGPNKVYGWGNPPRASSGAKPSA
jgi:hypothetical protein